MFKLRVNKNNQGAVWLVEPKVTIGRHTDNDLTITGDPGVAEHHIAILAKGNLLAVANLTRKPIVVNAKAVTARKLSLSVNDTITIGQTELTVVDPRSGVSKDPTLTRQVQASGWALKANHSALANKIYPLSESMIIGRSSSCDITIASAHLSRQHARLSVRDSHLFVQDLDSANGTFLNGQKVQEARVRKGDELRFDALAFGVLGPADDRDKTTVRSLSSEQKSDKNSVEQQKIPAFKARSISASIRVEDQLDKPGQVEVDESFEAEPSQSALTKLVVLSFFIAAGIWYWQKQ